MNNIGYSVRQIAGCNDYEQIPIEVPELPELEFVLQGAYCDTDDGEAEVTVTNIPGPFTYNWQHTKEDVNKLSGLALGNYTVAVTDARGCTKDSTITIAEALQLTVEVLKESSCGVPDGQAVVSATGGVEPYDYVWNDGTLNDTNNTMRPGTHFVNVTDKNGCASNISVVMPNDGSGPQVDYNNITHVKCYGDRSGAIDIDVSNVSGQYTIQWSNGAETEDVDSLAAGIYNVTVIGEDGCQGAGSFQVTQPARIDISSEVKNTSSCVGADGIATAIPSGGTKPYTYQWSSGGNYQIEEGLSAGLYSVTVTDARGCKNVAPVIVQDDGAPNISITDVQGVGCKINNNGSISAVANPFNPFYDYKWSNGQTTPSISDLEAGVYTLTVEDDNGCKGVVQAEVVQEPPAMNPICLVTVDPDLGMNKIVWEKQVTEDVDHYNVYRESYIKGNYELVGSVPADSAGVLVDSIADPSVRSWRYRLSVVDACGNESELSPYHKTMHLTMNVSTVAAEANLIWDPYVGFDFNTYRVFRAPTADVFSQIDSISASDRFTYTDKNAPGGEPVYYIEVQHPTGCQLTFKKASTLNESKSNRKSKLKTTYVENILGLASFNIYPNPSAGLVNIEMEVEGREDIRVMVIDISGRLLIERKISNVQGQLNTQLDLSGYESGVYQVLVKTSGLLLHRTLILE